MSTSAWSPAPPPYRYGVGAEPVRVVARPKVSVVVWLALVRERVPASASA
ncbi:MAG: hypothetical protein IT210_03430 [Armatimonadetes bacterium]|nr:hypothetical protein [Armatimonadota bacterium]